MKAAMKRWSDDMTNDSEVERRRQELINERMERLHKPDGLCCQCEKPANRYHPIGPLIMRISERDQFTYEFCCWECIFHWGAMQAGREAPYAAQAWLDPGAAR
jgi:hypothetical protein